MKQIVLVLAAALAGCAASPEQMARQSDIEVCRFTMGGSDKAVADAEAQRRGLNCTAYYPAIVERIRAEKAAADYQRSIAPPQERKCITVYRGRGDYDTVCN